MDLENFTDVLGDADEIANSQPLSLSLSPLSNSCTDLIRPTFRRIGDDGLKHERPARCTGQQGAFRSVEEIDEKYRDVFTYKYFNLVQSRVIDDALYSDKSLVVCAPTGSGKTVIFEMAIVQLLMDLDDKNYTGDFKIIYMAPVKALCTERLSEWYPKFTKLGLMCIEVTGDTNVDFSHLKPYKIIITTPEKWDILTRRWRDHKSLVEVVKLFLIDEVHILNDDTRGPVLEAVVSRMKTIESSSQTAHRIEQLQKQYQTKQDIQDDKLTSKTSLPVRIRFIAVSATISNPEDVAAWLGASDKPAQFYKFGDECRPVKLKRVVEGYPCAQGTSIFKFDIILNYKLWPIIQKYHDGKPTLIFCNTRKSVAITAEALSRELTINFTPEQQSKLSALASTIKNKKLQALVLSGVGCHHAGLLFEERLNIENAFRNRDLPILITTTTLAMGVNLPAHLVIIKNTQQYVNGAYQEYSISTVLQMVGRAGRPQFDTEATAVIMTRLQDKPRYQALVGGDEPLQSYLHKRLAENLNSEAALGTVCDVAQCVQWLLSTFLSVRATKDPKRYLALPPNANQTLISKKIEELCVKAMNGLATSGLITMDEASCIESTETGRLMSIFYLDLETMKHIMKIEGTETLERLLWIVCECHELADMHLRVDERRTLNTLNRNNSAATIRFPMKGKISTRQMKLNCIIQAILGCLPIPDPSLNQEAMKVMRIADRVCKCIVAYVTRPDLISCQPQYYSAVLNALTLAKCVEAHLWENSPYVSKQLKGIGPTFSSLLATAGKVNFTLLEESHPRDLERIMNKGAPAGNVIRKQVSFLPKYQLTATPIDEKRLTLQLQLLNQHQLAENREELTAGDSHKCYVVVGDSENCLLLFTTFKDKDLISVYNGVITYEITRKHNSEHRIKIHCISSNWVGIDVHCDYLFKNLEPELVLGETINLNSIADSAEISKKQPSTRTLYNERKRKNNENVITESKEKRKRDTALIEKFKLLKTSFEVTSKELKENHDKSAQMSDIIKKEMINPNYNQSKEIFDRPTNTLLENIDVNVLHPVEKNNFVDLNKSKPTTSGSNYECDYSQIEELDDDEENIVVDDHINSIMNEIETEIWKGNSDIPRCTNPNVNMTLQPVHKVQSSFFINSLRDTTYGRLPNSHCSNFAQSNTCFNKRNEKKKRKFSKSNYSFMDAIENNIKLDNDYDNVPQKDSSGFSDTIKNQLTKFLQRTTANSKQDDATINGLLNCEGFTEVSSKQMVQSPAYEMSYGDCSSTNYTIPLSLELPAVSINPSATSQNDVGFKFESDQVRHVDEEKPMDNIISNVTNIEKIVNEIEHEYNITKESDDQAITHSGIDVEFKCPERKNNNFNMSEKNPQHEYFSKCHYDKVINENNFTEPTDCMVNKGETHFKINNDSLVSVNYNLKTSNNDKFNKFLNKNKFVNLSHLSFLDSKSAICSKGHSDETFCNSNNKITPIICKELTPLHNKEIQVVGKDIYNHNNRDDSPNESDTRNLEIITEFKSPTRTDIILESMLEKENQPDYINRYSFTTTKIDVCTKTLPDQQIKIIRKLKLDLDVTELVTKMDVKSTKETKNIETSHELMKNYQTDGEDLEIQKQTNLTLDCPLNDLQNFANIESKSKENSRSKETYLPGSRHTEIKTINKASKFICTIPESNYSIKQILDETKCVNKECSSKTEFSTGIKNAPEFKTHEGQKEDIEQYKKYLQDIATAKTVPSKEKCKPNTMPKTESKNTGFETEINVNTDIIIIDSKQKCDETKNNKIESILQKYNGVLRKSNQLNKGTVHSEKKTVKLNRPCLEKTRRPYKISDIQNLHIAPLPKIALEASNTPQPPNITISKISDEQVDEISNPGEITQGHTINIAKNNTNMVEHLPENIPSPVTDTDIPQVGLVEDHDFDHSMFNPQVGLVEDHDLDHSMFNPQVGLVEDHDLDHSMFNPQVGLVEDHDLDHSMFNPQVGLVEDHDLDHSMFNPQVGLLEDHDLDHSMFNPQVELVEDHDLDPSMFNPKTLLQQCFTTEESNGDDNEIITPPSEFCDKTVNPPDQYKDVDSFSQESSQAEQTSNRYAYNQSIFEDNQSVLTPSVEIETWTLSRDEDNENTENLRTNLLNPQNCSITDTEPSDFRQMHNKYLFKSYTVMRKNSSNNLESDSRGSKLGHFQFKQKKKFKL